MAPLRLRRFLIGLVASSLWLAVLDVPAASVAQVRTRPAATTRQAPSKRDVLNVLRRLPGKPTTWRFPGSVARTVSYQPATMTDSTRTHAVVFETVASTDSVRSFYEAAIEKSGAHRLEPSDGDGWIVLAFQGGSVTIGRDRGVTFIVLVAEQRPVGNDAAQLAVAPDAAHT